MGKQKLKRHQVRALKRNPNRWYNACGTKEAHGSRKKALARKAQSLRLARDEDEYRDAERLEPYKCAVCGSWHLGHERRTETKRKERQLELERRDANLSRLYDDIAANRAGDSDAVSEPES